MCTGPVKWTRHRGKSWLTQSDDAYKHARHILGTTRNGMCIDAVITFEGARADLLSKRVCELLRKEFTELEIK